uniref:Reverse transcriptase Ty1/copia-type domain-containing protein n=1 Tax=Bracon brevicornis TaxID=1563983 RepID=A0A6V7JGQ0_9HYME
MEQIPYRQLAGGLIHLANATRPDIHFAANLLSCFCSDSGSTHWKAAKRVHRYLKGTANLGISYVKQSQCMRCFVGADWAGDTDKRKSSRGYLLLSAAGPMSWATKKQKSVASSIMEAEHMGLSEVTKEVIHMRRLINSMGFGKLVENRTVIFCENQSAIHLSKNFVYHGRSKHIHTRYHFTREAQHNNLIEI